MKDYYKNRVLTDFKPGVESDKSKSDEDDGGSADMSPTSLKEKDKDRKWQEKSQGHQRAQKLERYVHNRFQGPEGEVHQAE